MKKPLCILLLFFICFFASAVPHDKLVVVNYKGMESGLEDYPDWLEAAYDGDSKTVCKELKIDQTKYKVFVVLEENQHLEYAKNAAIKNVYKQFLPDLGSDNEAELTSAVSEVNGIEFVTDFWIQFQNVKTKKKYYDYYAVYKMSK